MLDITQRYRPDFVIAHLFGRSPSVSIKELKGKGYPLSKVIGLVWAAAEADIKAAGGWRWRKATTRCSSPASARTIPVLKEIKAMYKAQGKPRAQGDGHRRVYYNRGVLHAALHVEAMRNAHQGQGRRAADRRGREERHRADQGLHPGRPGAADEVTPADHEGGGWVQI